MVTFPGFADHWNGNHTIAGRLNGRGDYLVCEVVSWFAVVMNCSILDASGCVWFPTTSARTTRPLFIDSTAKQESTAELGRTQGDGRCAADGTEGDLKISPARRGSAL